VEAIVSTRAAVLQALTDGPRYGRELIRILAIRAQGLVNPRPGTVYRAAESLVRRRLLHTWMVVPGGRRGARSRRFYELTPKGVAAVEVQREAMNRLLGATATRESADEERLMGERVRRAADVSAFTLKLQRGIRESE